MHARRRLSKVGTDARARALGILEVNFCLGIIRFWEVNFAQALGFWQIDKKCVIFDKKVTYLMKISNFGTLKFMKTCPVIRFLGTFLPRHQVSFGKFCPA